MQKKEAATNLILLRQSRIMVGQFKNINIKTLKRYFVLLKFISGVNYGGGN